jgi:hypothetical protein
MLLKVLKQTLKTNGFELDNQYSVAQDERLWTLHRAEL